MVGRKVFWWSPLPWYKGQVWQGDSSYASCWIVGCETFRGSWKQVSPSEQLDLDGATLFTGILENKHLCSSPVLLILTFFCSTVDMLRWFWGSLSLSGPQLRASTWADIQCYSTCSVKLQWKPSCCGQYQDWWRRPTLNTPILCCAGACCGHFIGQKLILRG